MDEKVLDNYLHHLVGCFFKILPLRESEESSLHLYMVSLQAEILGCYELVVALKHDELFLTLVSILQYLIDHPDETVGTYKRESFKAISICNKLRSKYIRAEVVKA